MKIKIIKKNRDNLLSVFGSKEDKKIIIKNDDIEKIDLIKKCKLVLNLHYYENACLETCRINEILEFFRIDICKFNNNFELNEILFELTPFNLNFGKFIYNNI